MASAYIKEIKTIQPQGPYTIVGLCMGCTIGHEMAYQLVNSGEQVNALIMFDPDLPELVFKRKIRQPGSLMTKLSRAHLDDGMKSLVEQLLKRKLFYRLALLKGRLRIARKSFAGPLEKRRAIRRHHNWQLNQAYMPNHYEGKTVVIQSGEYYRSMNRVFENSANCESGHIQIHTLEGSHTSIFSPPKVFETAALIQKSI